MADNTIEIEIEFEGKKGFATLKSDAFKAGQDAGDASADGFKEGFSKLKGIVAAAAATIGGIITAHVVGESIKAAAEQESAINRLNAALSRTGQYSFEFSKQMEDLATSIQKTSVFADEAVLSGAAMLQTIGKLDQQKLVEATKAATDLAAAYKIDLESAFSIVGKAAEGHVGTLSRIGIEVRKGSSDAETFANALEKINKVVGGAAANDLNTFSGSVAKMKNSFGEVLESMGNIIIKSPAFIGTIKGLGKVFDNISEMISKSNFGKSFNAFILDVSGFPSIVARYLITPLERFLEVGSYIFKSLKLGVQAVVVGMASFGTTVIGILNKLGVVSDETDKTFQLMYVSTKETLDLMNKETSTAFESIGTGTFGEKVAKQFDIIKQSAEATKSVVSDVINGTAIDPWVAKFEIAADKIDKIFQQTLMKGISSTMQMVGASLIKGGSAFQNFGTMVLGIIGDMAINIGETLVALGLGIDQLKLALATMSGGFAIAAGLALIAVGGALKALAGGGAGAGNLAGATGAAAGPTAMAPAETVPPESFERQSKKTEVVVNVEGNIFSGREQAMAIVENLQEYFDTNSGVLVRA